MSKLTIRTIPLLALLLLAGVKQASAQGVSAYFGLGSAFDSAATSSGCAPQQLFDPFTGVSGTCETAPTMGGVFGVFGADFMINPHLGVNGEYSFRFAQADYLPAASLKVRPGFYDFNAVYQPTASDKRVVPVLEGGIGGAKLSFYVSQQAGSIFTQSQFFTSSNHFQVHGGVGVKLYVKSDIFIKPQFDIHYVPNLTDQYGRNTVPEFTISIGYTFGRQ
ncbi:MAG TPA: outer membrane beta-barrel protein [Verrucomicrobiae bacterium]|nr:outer membrane beta-barrel protein [Verrucomicrobiae bacterium]